MTMRALMPALTISLLLCACGGSANTEEMLEARRDALAKERIGFTAEVTASPASGEVFDCALSVSSTPEETVLTVIKPEPVSGVRATARRGETVLRYEDVLLSLGPEAAEIDSPLGGVAALAEALRSGHVIRSWTEREGETLLIAAEVYVDETHDLTVWCDAESLAPVHASLSRSGAETLRCAIRDFRTGEQAAEQTAAENANERLER